MKQKEIFRESEGDRWFERNRKNLKPGEDPILELVKRYVPCDERTRVLEVGASNGYRLAKLHELYRCELWAVEPSKKACEEGKKEFSYINFICSPFEDVSLENLKGEFDLVIVNFVLHWVDRENLLFFCAQVDRCLKEGGYLVLGDFLTPLFIKNRYHHRKDVELFTYKADYRQIFKATGLYVEIENRFVGEDIGDVDRMGWVSLMKKTDLYLLSFR